jgi:hypothetical protein
MKATVGRSFGIKAFGFELEFEPSLLLARIVKILPEDNMQIAVFVKV